jgi:hypothetical protein
MKVVISAVLLHLLDMFNKVMYHNSRTTMSLENDINDACSGSSIYDVLTDGGVGVETEVDGCGLGRGSKRCGRSHSFFAAQLNAVLA